MTRTTQHASDDDLGTGIDDGSTIGALEAMTVALHEFSNNHGFLSKLFDICAQRQKAIIAHAKKIVEPYERRSRREYELWKAHGERCGAEPSYFALVVAQDDRANGIQITWHRRRYHKVTPRNGGPRAPKPRYDKITRGKPNAKEHRFTYRPYVFATAPAWAQKMIAAVEEELSLLRRESALLAKIMGLINRLLTAIEKHRTSAKDTR